MNAWYLLLTSVGAFLGPVASGYVANGQGWRWMWWWCVIFLSIQFIATIFFYEESKFVPKRGVSAPKHDGLTDDGVQGRKMPSADLTAVESQQPSGNVTGLHVDPSITPKTYRQRMALYTPTDAPILQHLYQPLIILTTFPAVAYTAITFGSVLACFAILTTIQAIYLIEPPYNFSPSGVGLFNLPPFIGCFIGFFVGGWLNDKSIMWLAKRNQGIYEPEQRLWMAIPASVFLPVGMLIFGIGLSNIVGDALVGVVFTRNAISVVILFVLEYWLAGMGLRGLHILMACVMLAILLLPAVLLKFGKHARIRTQDRYKSMAVKQPTHRTF
ncbi:hypothetical protein PMZ80_007370 [Knufia obscura]|uniref:Uncharacterized protein n=1 Tax=Knufia obscura TaxID=1635080 RepID=A0ABR0RI80_9EURO|nr:hypothetical protein PMZ80_007370 [Knufia obscura]